MPLDIVVPVAIPSGGGWIMHGTLSYDGNVGKGWTTWLNNIEEVSDQNRESIIRAKHVAERFTGREFERNTVLQFDKRWQAVTGRSWEMMLALAMTSLKTGVQMRQGLTGSGEIDDSGKIKPVGAIAEKVKAAGQEGYKLFLVAENQTTDNQDVQISGDLQVVPVGNIKQAWCIASGLPPWQPVGKTVLPHS